MRILDRYIGGQFLRLFLGFVLAAPVLFIIGDITERLDDYFNEGLSVGQVALLYLYQLPQFILWSFPVAALIATVFTINGMARHSEIAASKAGGVSFYRLLVPVLLVAIVLTGGALGLSEVVPIATRAQAEIRGDEGPTGSRGDFVYRAVNGRVYTIRRLDAATGEIHGLTVEQEGDGVETPGLHLVAQRARYHPTEGWTFFEGYERRYWRDGREETAPFTAMRAPELEETPEQLMARPKEPEEMGYAELGRFIEIIERSGGRPLELMVKRAEKISLPIATLIIVLFAAPLAMTSHRGGTAFGIGLALGITVFYLMLFKVGEAAGKTGALSPELAAWMPNFLFLAAAGVLLARVET